MSPKRALGVPEADPERQRRATELVERAERPARRGQLRFGIAGWTDRTLIQSKLFYPKHAHKPALRLRHHAARFELAARAAPSSR